MKLCLHLVRLYRTQAELQLLCPKTPIAPISCSLQHHSQTERDVGCRWCCTQGDLQVQGIAGDMGCSPRGRGWCLEEVLHPEAALAVFSVGTGKGRRRGRPAQKQSSLFACVGLSTCTCGCRPQQQLFFFSSCTMLVVITGGLILNSTMKTVK